jgi:3-deoxy-D-manno-octulosonate 8-phosphate phosphatase (KDO 8-P phosphatase)
MSEYPDSFRHGKLLNDCLGERSKIKLLILDVDGVLTDGTKVYDQQHNPVYKTYRCKDFTAIKRFIAAGVQVIMLSGDAWNREMAIKRNIPFYCTRGNDLSLDKSRYIDHLESQYGVSRDNMAFVGDDYFDLSMFKKLFWSFSPSDAPQIIKDNSLYVLQSRGGEGVIVELYDFLVSKDLVTEATEEAVAELDKKEASSAAMQ